MVRLCKGVEVTREQLAGVMLLHSLLAANSAGVNLDEPMRTLRTSTRNI